MVHMQTLSLSLYRHLPNMDGFIVILERLWTPESHETRNGMSLA